MTENIYYPSPLLRFLMSPQRRIIRHLSLIVLLLILLLLSGDEKQPEYTGNLSFYIGALILIWFFCPLYLNMYVLVPRLLFRKKLITYLFCTFVLIVVSFLVTTISDEYLQRYRINPSPIDRNMVPAFLGFLLIASIIIAASTAVKLFQRWTADNYKLAEMQRISLQNELDQLKSQINPHFLFNTLNNLNVLIDNDQKKAGTVVHSLTRLLRYQLYQGKRELVPLQSDLDFLEDFLALEKIRRDDFTYQLNLSGNTLGILIPHFLFIPFVENAVKHSHDGEKPSYITINFIIEAGKLQFTCFNSVSELTKNIEKQSDSGIGLSNILRRLELLYDQRFDLVIHDNKSSYSVKLEIPL